MITFDEIKSHLSQKIDRLAQFVQIEERQNFFIIEYEKTKQCFIIIDIKKDTNTCTFNININEISIIIEEFDYTKIFEIRNATKIGFIPVDGKQGFLGGQSHCDFIVFDVNDFCFVELKLNATSERKIKKNREKAIEQLVSTINFFNKKLDKNGSSVCVMQWRGVIKDKTLTQKDIASILDNCFLSRTS